MKNYDLTLQKVSKTKYFVNKELKEEIIENFLFKIYNFIYTNNIHPSEIWNMDQTSIFYEYPSDYTINFKNSENVQKNFFFNKIFLKNRVQVYSNEKKRCSLIIACNIIGEKLKSFAIFSGTLDGRILKEISKFDDNNIIFRTQKNAWMNSKLFEEWLNNFWYPYALSTPRTKILILDSYSLHKQFKKEIQQKNTKVFIIPPNMTPILQPLDQNVNKEIKNSLKKIWIETQSEFALLTNEESKRKKIIFDIKKAINSITKEIIISSWKKAGIYIQIEGIINIE